MCLHIQRDRGWQWMWVLPRDPRCTGSRPSHCVPCSGKGCGLPPAPPQARRRALVCLAAPHQGGLERAQGGVAGRGGEGQRAEKEAPACSCSAVSQALSLPSPSEREIGAKGSDRALRLLVAPGSSPGQLCDLG